MKLIDNSDTFYLIDVNAPNHWQLIFVLISKINQIQNVARTYRDTWEVNDSPYLWRTTLQHLSEKEFFCPITVKEINGDEAFKLCPEIKGIELRMPHEIQLKNEYEDRRKVINKY